MHVTRLCLKSADPSRAFQSACHMAEVRARDAPTCTSATLAGNSAAPPFFNTICRGELISRLLPLNPLAGRTAQGRPSDRGGYRSILASAYRSANCPSASMVRVVRNVAHSLCTCLVEIPRSFAAPVAGTCFPIPGQVLA